MELYTLRMMAADSKKGLAIAKENLKRKELARMQAQIDALRDARIKARSIAVGCLLATGVVAVLPVSVLTT